MHKVAVKGVMARMRRRKIKDGGARGCLVLYLNSADIEESEILDEEAHLGSYREARNVAVVSIFIVARSVSLINVWELQLLIRL